MMQHPIKDDTIKKMAMFICNNSSLVTAKNSYSKSNLLDVGVNESLVKTVTDPALSIKKIQIDNISTYIKGLVDTMTDASIGVCVRHMYWCWDEKQTSIFIDKLSKVIDKIIEETNSNSDVSNPNIWY